eukprot:jgi/Ulvmu1/12271/UM087_0005.1
MSQGVFQPIGQKRLTNIAVVRFKKAGKRFEIACYKNKVLDWRQGSEKDLDEVLQTTEVFQNVSKGLVAHNDDLTKAFGTSDREAICREILAKGDLQVSEKERQVELGALFKDVATIIVEKCINPDTQRPYTVGLIERGLKDIHFAVDPKRSAKQQALEALPQLQQRFPIARAMMRIAVSVPMAHRDDLADMLHAGGAVVEEEDIVGDAYTATALIQPGTFRNLYNFVSQRTGGAGRLDVVAVAAQDVAGGAKKGAAAAGAGGLQAAATGGGTASGVTAGLAGLTVGDVPAAAGGYTAAAGSNLVMPAASRARSAPSGEVAYERGAITAIPEQWANRRAMFQELDTLQPGWTVELRARGAAAAGAVDAVFFDPAGEQVGAFAAARRRALQARKEAAA